MWIIIGISVLSILGAWVIGVPILSIMYNTDMREYKYYLIILLIGGCFLAMNNFFSVILTIQRQQFRILLGYSFVAAIAYITTGNIVQLYGINGATWMYVGLMVALTVIFCFVF